MLSRIKRCGLIVALTCAAGATLATSAQATAGTLTTFPAGQEVTLTATSETISFLVLTDHLIAGSPAKVSCHVHYDGVGTAREGDTTFTFTPTFTQCNAFGLNATVSETGCHLLLHTGTPTGAGGWHVTKDLVCGVGAAIKIVTATCEVLIESQSGLTTSEATNTGTSSQMDITIHTDLTGTKYKVAKDGIGCPLSGTGSFSKGDYEGNATVTATTHAGVPVGITLH